MARGQITHIDIPADDLERAKRFYEGVAGWEIGSMPEFPDYLLFRTSETTGGGIGKRGKTAPERVRHYIDVSSMDEIAPKVEALGGTIVQPKAEVAGQGWYLVVKDTEGNEFGLWENAQR